MRILIVTPAPPGSRKGNRITALRWAGILRDLGHQVGIALEFQQQRCDLLIALHAAKSHESVTRFRRLHPDRPLIVALTGTDLYGDIHTDPRAVESLELADRLIVLQPLGVQELPLHVRNKARVIYQSVQAPARLETPRDGDFEVCVMGHLRPVKDPFRTALAARLVPVSSRIEILHVGAALSDDMAETARAEMASNPRYHWLGEKPRTDALRLLSRCRLLALTSRSEGGANVISEALTVGVPVIASRIPGSVGLLGEEYPGYFPFGDTTQLAALLRRAETDRSFYALLRRSCRRLRGLASPAREMRTWRTLLREFAEV
jgi:putative glycosyltransferase (TIGR04348 family)